MKQDFALFFEIKVNYRAARYKNPTTGLFSFLLQLHYAEAETVALKKHT